MFSALLVNHRQHWNLILILLEPVLPGGDVTHLEHSSTISNVLANSSHRCRNSELLRCTHLQCGA